MGWGGWGAGGGCFPVSVKPPAYDEHFFKESGLQQDILLLAGWESAVEVLITNQVSSPPASFHRPRRPGPKASRTSTCELKWTPQARIHFWRSGPHLPACLMARVNRPCELTAKAGEVCVNQGLPGGLSTRQMVRARWCDQRELIRGTIYSKVGEVEKKKNR